MQTIFYNMTHGYRSKVDPDRMFTHESDAREHDRERAVDLMISFNGPVYNDVIQPQGRKMRGQAERAARYLADHLKDLSDQEDLAAARAEEAVRPKSDPVEMSADHTIKHNTINRDEI